MKTITGLICAVLGFAWSSIPARAQTAPRSLGFTEAEKLALSNSTSVKMAAKGVEASRRGLSSTKALRLPKVQLESNVLLWNEALAFDLVIPGMMPPPGMEPERIVVRDRVTTSTTLSAVLPLSGQLVLGKMISAQRRGVSVAKLGRASSMVDAASRAADAYVSVLLAESAVAIATTRVKQLKSQLVQAEVLRKGGVLQEVDLLRLKAALAAAQAEVITASSHVRLALGLLVLTTGLPPLTAIRVKDDFPERPRAPSYGIVEAVKVAESRRQDLAMLRERARQADTSTRIERLRLLPNIAAVASLQYNQGAGSLQPKYAWFAGVTLTWDVWDWGHQWHKHKHAKAEAARASLAAVQLRDGVRIEVGTVASQAHTAHQLLDVRRRQVTAAREAFRIQQIRFKAGAATTSDLLDSEAALAQAELAYSTARYTYFRSLIQLAKATGQLPSALLAKL